MAKFLKWRKIRRFSQLIARLQLITVACNFLLCIILNNTSGALWILRAFWYHEEMQDFQTVNAWKTFVQWCNEVAFVESRSWMEIWKIVLWHVYLTQRVIIWSDRGYPLGTSIRKLSSQIKGINRLRIVLLHQRELRYECNAPILSIIRLQSQSRCVKKVIRT